MNLLAKLLIYDRRINMKKNNGVGIADDENFIILIEKIKVLGKYVNTIHDIIHGEKIM